LAPAFEVEPATVLPAVPALFAELPPLLVPPLEVPGMVVESDEEQA